ncbi:MAG: DUF2971 domain-containing protein [Flavobacteriia bacterium]|nr:DUF2971 domain-containing protein [Flavobacteriia bacterium]
MKINLEKISIEVEDKKLDIKINDGIELPKSLYKYYSLSYRAVESLENHTVHFGHAFSMNDLMDGNFLLWDFNRFLDTFMYEMQIPQIARVDLHADLIKKLSDEFLKYLGYFCLCENYMNDLLWSHYTAERGYCLEFDREKLLDNFKEHQNYFFPINYSDLKKIDFQEYSDRIVVGNKVSVGANIPLFYSLANKEKFWSYEREWRLVIRDERFSAIVNPQVIISDEEKKIQNQNLHSRNLKIELDSINKVILATLFFNNDRFNNIEKIDNTSFRLQFTENKEKIDLQKFLTILKNEFPDKIFQVEKVVGDKISREIKYKLDILDVSNEFVDIRYNNC